MAPQSDRQWLVDILDEHGTRLYRLSSLLGAGSEAKAIVRTSLMAVGRRGGRLVDPLERIEFVQEQVVHHSRSARGSGRPHFPQVAERRGQEILQALEDMPVKLSEILVVSHYLATFGPQLATIMRMTVSGANKRLEDALEALRERVGEPSAISLPGVLESLSQELAAALLSAARLINATKTEKLKSELLAQGENTGRRVAWYLAAPILGLSLLGGVMISYASTPEPPPASPQPSASSEPVPTASRSLAARVRGVPVHYLGREDNRLYREFRDLASTGDLVAAALDATLAVAPLDPDYRSAWSAGRVLGTQLADSVLTIDLSAEAYEGIDTAAAADLAALQMVYTAGDLLGDPDLRVRFLADGAAPPEEFSHQPEDGVARRGLDPMPSLWMTAPRNNQVYDEETEGQILITGLVKTGVDVVTITITDAEGEAVLTSSPDRLDGEPRGSGWRVWNHPVTLDPGSYMIRAVALTDPEDDSEPDVEMGVETKTITVE